MHELKAVRVYDLSEDDEGYRILIDRLWPRGIRKDTLRLDLWVKDLAPSKELRKWFNHIGERFDRFEAAYREELSENPAAEEFIGRVAETLKSRDILFLYAAKDKEHNNAVVLMKWVKEQLERI